MTAITWAEETWNPTVGCHHKSPGCDHCYAEALHKRLTAMGQPNYADPFHVVKAVPTALEKPLKRKAPTTWFVNSMSDLFHADISLDYVQQVFAVMGQAHWHQFLILTKRSERLPSLAGRLPWHPNVWMGVSIENQDYAYRADHLRQVPAAIRFISAEPLIGPLKLDLSGIHWVICGGESGPGYRPMDLDWARSLRDQCGAAGAAFFLKQLGGIPKRDKHEAVLDGRTWVQMPGGMVLRRNSGV